jgi:hypothetical protein
MNEEALARLRVVVAATAIFGASGCGTGNSQSDGNRGFVASGGESAGGGAPFGSSGGTSGVASTGGSFSSSGAPGVGGDTSNGGSTTSTGGSLGSGGAVTSSGGTTGSGGRNSGGAPMNSGGASDADAGTNPPDGGASDDPCFGGSLGVASDGGSSRAQVSGYGNVEVTIPTTNHIVSLETTLAVPTVPPANGTLFLWPGLQPLPNGANFDPIGEGVLQPVLTWGGTCAPNAPNDYSDWWISAQYVNVYNVEMTPGHTGCLGGDGMKVQVGDQLHIAMTLSGTAWTQVVTDEQNGKKVDFAIDMLGQAQDWAIFDIESDGREPLSDIVFTHTVLTFASPAASSCAPSTRGQNDYFSAPETSSDGTRCCIGEITLRGQGVPATTMD